VLIVDWMAAAAGGDGDFNLAGDDGGG